MRYGRLILALGSVMAMAGAFTLPGLETPAGAQAPLRAAVLLTQKAIPPRLAGRDLVRHARRHRARQLEETQEPNVRQRSWRVNVVFRFNRAPETHQLDLLFYDLHEGRRFVASKMVLTGIRPKEIFSEDIVLERPRFHPNRPHEVVVTSRRREVGKTRFAIVGERPPVKRSFDFTGP